MDPENQIKERPLWISGKRNNKAYAVIKMRAAPV